MAQQLNKILSVRMPPLSLLILQGPASPFLKEVARVAEAKGAAVHKINFCIGDAIFWWSNNSDWFRKRNDEWPDFLRDYILRNKITDILMLGDGRPKHAEAIRAAKELGIRAHIFEHGYLRPDWLTLEPWGMSSASLLPASADAIRQLASGVARPATNKLFSSSFFVYACYDLLFHLPNVALGWLIHPHYRTHGPVHPLTEYAGWIGKAFRQRARQNVARKLEETYLSKDGPDYFLFPLQLAGDYQIKLHAPSGNLFMLVEAVVKSFARHSAPKTRLLFKTHPLDNGLDGWAKRLRAWARENGVEERVDLIDGGNLDRQIEKAQGIVTINSTVGLTALLADKPVIALGAAIYDLEGLTAQTSLAEFWQNPTPPDADMPETFTKALAATTQFRGGFIGKEAMQLGAEALCDKLFDTPTWISNEAPRKRSVFRYEAELLSQ